MWHGDVFTNPSEKTPERHFRRIQISGTHHLINVFKIEAPWATTRSPSLDCPLETPAEPSSLPRHTFQKLRLRWQRCKHNWLTAVTTPPGHTLSKGRNTKCGSNKQRRRFEAPALNSIDKKGTRHCIVAHRTRTPEERWSGTRCERVVFDANSQ